MTCRSSACPGDFCNVMPRSLLARSSSLLARKLAWPSHLQQARRQRRSLVAAARRAVRRVLLATKGLHGEARRAPYDPMLDLARLALEFGFVVMFTVVWPLAPLACLLISALEQRAAAVRLTIACQRPAAGLRCNGLGTGDAWFDIFVFIAWLSVPINVGMIALATQQLDIYFETPLPPFEKLLCAVVAEHVLLGAKFVISFALDSAGADDPASEAAEAERRRYLRGLYGLGAETAMSSALGRPGSDGALSSLGVGDGEGADAAAAAQPRLASVFPASGPCATGAAVTLRGERLGLAISRGELTLRLHLPRAATRAARSRAAEPGGVMHLAATFISDRKITCVLPPCATAGVATIEVVRLDGEKKPSVAPPITAPKPTSPKRPSGPGGHAIDKGTMAAAAAAALAEQQQQQQQHEQHEQPPAAVGALGASGGGADAVGRCRASASFDGGAGGGAMGQAIGTPPPPGVVCVEQLSRAGPSASAATPSREMLPAEEGNLCRFRYYGAFTLQKLKPSCGPLVGGTPVRVLGSGFVETSEITCCVRMGGVERRIPAAFVSESEVRFLTPSFTEVGDAKVALALNGHDYDTASEPLCFQYQAAPMACLLQ